MSENGEDISAELKKATTHSVLLDDRTSVASEESSTNPSVGLWLSQFTVRETVVVHVGPERSQYWVHKGLFAAKSPYFRTLFKNCWDGKKEDIEIGDISSDGFSIVVDWMYSGQLPGRVKEYSKDGPEPWSSTLDAYKAADVLMIDKLQNEIVANEAAILVAYGLKWRLSRLRNIHDNDLCHTKYYDFVLKSVVANMMSNQDQSPKQWDQDMKSVESNSEILADLLRSTRDWARKPWRDFPKGDLTEFFIQEKHEELVVS